MEPMDMIAADEYDENDESFIKSDGNWLVKLTGICCLGFVSFTALH